MIWTSKLECCLCQYFSPESKICELGLLTGTPLIPYFYDRLKCVTMKNTLAYLYPALVKSTLALFPLAVLQFFALLVLRSSKLECLSLSLKFLGQS
jgi:prepilin signal peptidase PulO-like enzyme (type II secretory pathway)